ncbi:ATPase-AAA-core domain-containing protein, partial [Favolaschia claudopus]
KQNKTECLELMETTHKVICEIINLHMKCEVPGSLPLDIVDHIGKFVETLHKMYAFLEAQQDGNKIKQLFRIAEGNSLLKDCQAGLAQAVKAFKIDTTLKLMINAQELEDRLNNMHQELLQTIREFSDAATTTCSEISSVSSPMIVIISNSFSLLPPIPKVFHGRESEIQIILEMFEKEMLPRIAILGGGGMGKTSLATAVLHHPTMLAKFKHRFFVSAEAAKNSIDLAALIGLHVGLDPGADLTKPVVRYFQKTKDCLLVLDNLETIWDTLAAESQDTVEQFLSMLDDIAHLALIITMRGAERPGKVCWTHPFLSPLQPLSQMAALQTFMDITDNSYCTEDIAQVLQFTDYMPLAVDLMANLVDYEGLSAISYRWEEEHTSALAMGYDRKSNLDVSISLSLSSPRVTAQSKELLGLLSILPNGLSDIELVQSKLAITRVLECKSILLATSLAYQDNKQRLRSLVPVREYIQQYLPPSESMMQCLQAYFYAISQMYHNYNDKQLHSVINQITCNLANLQEILQRGLTSHSSDMKDAIYCVFHLNSFYRITSRQSMPLMKHVESMLPSLADNHIEATFLVENLLSERHKLLLSKEWIAEKESVFDQIDDAHLQAKFYRSLGRYFLTHESNPVLAKKYLQIALNLSESSGDIVSQSNALTEMCNICQLSGNYVDADVYISRAQQVSQLSGDLYAEARACFYKAILLTEVGDYKKAVSQLNQSQQNLDICGLSGGDLHYQVLIRQAEIHWRKTEFIQAQAIYSQILENTSADNNGVSYVYALLNVVYIDIAKDMVTSYTTQDLDTARNILNQYERDMLACDMAEAELNLKCGNIDLARLQFEKVVYSARGGNIQCASHCLEKLGNFKLWPLSERQVISTLVFLSHAIHHQQKLEIHKALLFFGDILVAGDEATGMSLYTLALEGFTFMDIHQYRAECMIRLGDLAHKHGDQVKAKAFWVQARPLFERSSQTKSVAEVDSSL